MEKTIDARNLACPQPVIIAKKALEDSDTVMVIVNSRSSIENVTRMAMAADCDVIRDDRSDGTYLAIRRRKAPGKALMEYPISCADAASPGPTVTVFHGGTMGRGDDALGTVLMKSLLHTMAETGPFPDVMIFFNSAVKLAVTGSEVLDDLKSLEARGVTILVCGTCLDFFGLSDSLSAGRISNMYEIKDAMFSSGRLVQI